MARIVPFLIVCVVALVPANCGEDQKGLYGSQCDIISCSYDTIKCHLYEPPNHAVKIFYQRTLEEGTEYTAIIFCDMENVTKVEGTRFEGDEFLNRCDIYRPPPGEMWPVFIGNFCEFTKGGDEPDKEMKGKCAFAFENGYFMTAEFSCTPEVVQP